MQFVQILDDRQRLAQSLGTVLQNRYKSHGIEVTELRPQLFTTASEQMHRDRLVSQPLEIQGNADTE